MNPNYEALKKKNRASRFDYEVFSNVISNNNKSNSLSVNLSVCVRTMDVVLNGLSM